MSIKDAEKANRYEIVRQALRQTELRLEDLEKNASSAEHRLGWFTSLAVALASVSFLYAPNLSSPISTYIGGAAFLASGIFALWTALPRDFHIRGHYWEDWKGHYEDNDDIIDVLISQAAENDDRIITNEKELSRMAKKFRKSFNLMFYGACLIIGGQLAPVF